MSGLFGPDTLTPINQLKKALFDKYGSPDKRVKSIEKMERFRVDVCELSKGADGYPLSNVCVIWATPKPGTEIEVDLSGSIPLDGSVKAWIDSEGKPVVKRQKGTLVLSLKPNDKDKLSSLAKAMKARVGRGQPKYTSASHGFSAQEIAQGLERLREVLDTVWK
jgi:hypothetical protein